ncbi:substrate-binding domain-containing protein [Nibricoccus sp. IMCC34717]|uniref:substrate-binding domain-containing protein n=1 Tax=Nibricoccus sp. IMCC34717 TaxID=3034021 RepID=UPI00384A4879
MSHPSAPWLPSEILTERQELEPSARARFLLEQLCSHWPDPAQALPSERKLAGAWAVDRGAVNRATLQLLATGQLVRTGYKLFVPPERAIEPAGSAVIDAIVAHYIKPAQFEKHLKAAARDMGVRYRLAAPGSVEELNQALREAIARGAEAILFNISSNHEILRQLIEHVVRKGIPCAALGESPLPFNQVCVDAFACCESVLRSFASSGHRKAAIVIPADGGLETRRWQEAWIKATHAVGWPAAAAFVVPTGDRDLTPARIVPHLRAHAPEATAIFCYLDESAPLVRAGLLKVGENVAGDFSLIGYPDGPAMRTGPLPLSAVEVNLEQQLASAIGLLQQRIHRRSLSLKVQPRVTLRIAPDLELRASSPALGDARRNRKRFERTDGRWSHSLEERLRQVADLRDRTFLALPDSVSPLWRRLPLRRWCNRHLRKKNSWLGDFPLLHVQPGTQSVHGVPFTISGSGRDESLAVVMRSQHVRTHLGKPLEAEVAIPAEGKVERLFFLHACGWTDPGAHFASYWVDFTSGPSSEIQLRCHRKTAAGEVEGNIQDWWPTYAIILSKEALPHLVTGPDNDPHGYERYLYTLEWRNPTPERTVRRIRITSNPTLETTLAVLGVTCLLAPSAQARPRRSR